MKIPKVELLRDLVMVRAMSLELNKSKGGIIVPGDIDKMAPKKAVVIAAGPGTYNKKGEFVKAPAEPGDIILYMERDLIPVKIDDVDYLIVPSSEVLLKLGKEGNPTARTGDEDEDVTGEQADLEFFKEKITNKLIMKLNGLGLTQVEDMQAPVDFYIGEDGTEMTPAARSFVINEQTLDEPFSPPRDAKAFAMWQVVERVPGIYTGEFVARLAFLEQVGKRAD